MIRGYSLIVNTTIQLPQDKESKMITRSNCTTIDLAQFRSGRNLTPEQLSAKRAVEQIQASMVGLLAKDGSKEDQNLQEGYVATSSSYCLSEWSGPSNRSFDRLKFDPKSKLVETYESFQDMRSPYGDTGSNSESFKVDSQGREHYTQAYEFNGSYRRCCDLIIDKSGNIVQLFE